jgi:hypothetical protein
MQCLYKTHPQEIEYSCMGEFRDMEIPAQVVNFFFATRAGIPMFLNKPIQE